MDNPEIFESALQDMAAYLDNPPPHSPMADRRFVALREAVEHYKAKAPPGLFSDRLALLADRLSAFETRLDQERHAHDIAPGQTLPPMVGGNVGSR
jgi:hypothetical protein